MHRARQLQSGGFVQTVFAEMRTQATLDETSLPQPDFWTGMIEEPVSKPESGDKSRSTVWNQTSESRAEGGLALKTSGRARQPLPARPVSRSGTAGRLHFRPQ